MLKKGVDQKPEGSGITKPAAVDKSRSSKGDDKTAQWKALRDDYLLGADMKSDESDEDSERYVERFDTYMDGVKRS